MNQIHSHFIEFYRFPPKVSLHFVAVAFLVLGWVGLIFPSAAQSTATLKGSVTHLSEPLQGVYIQLKNINRVTQTDGAGKFSIKVPAETDLSVEISFLGMQSRFYTLNLKSGEVKQLSVELEEANRESKAIEIIAKRDLRDQVSIITIDPKIAKLMPSAFGDFNKVLSTLPGVVSNNELSSTYSVRGGNYNENLVYVNDMEVYRPMLISAGQQEGLSFVNPDLVKSVEFSSGGFQARYGDKLSSVMNVQYKTPTKFGGSVSLGILAQTGHIEGADSSGRVSYVVGLRRKSAQYLFQASKIIKGLDVKGEYLPQFVDAQSFVTVDITGSETRKTNPNRTTLSFLNAYARNRYLVRPASRETQFGTVQRVLRLFTAYEGEESMDYDTWQSGVKLSHRWNKDWKSDLMTSIVSTMERERVDIEGGYRLCDVETNQSKSNYNECITLRGVGTEYRYARNRMEGTVGQIMQRNYVQLDSSKIATEFGWHSSWEKFDDNLYEYSFVDSSDYVSVDQPVISKQTLNSVRTGAYVQQTWTPTDKTTVTYGIRGSYWTLNKEFIVSPRVQVAHKPEWKRDWLFKASAGIYQQQAFYRELRDYQGNLNKDLKAQKSAQAVIGADHRFHLWDREFQFTQEIWGKYLWDVVPYDIDNVRIRYYAKNNAKAYAMGYDMRVGGEFIRGAESWFSLGVLSTREDVQGDGKGYIRRPSDQRVTVGIFFQDHLPKNPSARMYLNLVYGSGLPFGPPKSIINRAALSAPAYRRVDIGFSKLISLSDKSTWIGKRFETIWLGLEVLNLIGAENVISYTWIKDVNDIQYAVPNTLSTRFINLRVQVKF